MRANRSPAVAAFRALPFGPGQMARKSHRTIEPAAGAARQKGESHRPKTARSHPLVLRSKSTQLVEYLRESIQRGSLPEPLPGGRLWSVQLGVSRRVLDEALQQLQLQGLLTVGRRGVRIERRPPTASTHPETSPRLVRVLLFAGYRGQNPGATLGILQERLRLRGMELRWEICSPARLREIARRPTPRGELFVLASVPSVHQRLFADTGKPALVLGEMAPGVSLPFINVDQAGTVRHATFGLLQRGFAEVSLVHVAVDSVGIKSALAAFRSACREWSKQPISPSLFPTSLDRLSLSNTAQRLAVGIKGRRGVIVVAPVPVSMIVSALLHHGVPIPQQAEVTALFHPSDALALYSPLTYYRSPIAHVVKHLTEAAVQFFETGNLPLLNKTLEAEIAQPE